WGGGGVIGGPIDGAGTAAFRVVAHHYQSDGFRRNAFLGRDDTNGYDEDTLRARVNWQPTADLDLGFTAMLVDIDDGYDAFAIDNSRVTRADHPGVDQQRSAAGALRLEYGGFDAATLRSVSTYADSKI